MIGAQNLVIQLGSGCSEEFQARFYADISQLFGKNAYRRSS